MSTFTRYVLGQLARIFIFALVALTLLLVIGGVVRQAVDHGLPPAQVLRLVPYLLPEMLRITVPVTLLLATTTVYSRMAGANEVVAIKSMGISPMVIIWPAVFVAVLLSLATLWMNDLAVSWGRKGAQRVLVEAVEEIAYGMLRTHKQYNSPIFSINVKDVEGRTLILPVLSLKKRETTPGMTLRAEQAELRCDKEANTLKIVAVNGDISFKGGEDANFDFPGEFTLDIPLEEASGAGRSSQTPSALPLGVIRKETIAQNLDIKQYEHEMTARAMHEMLSGDFDAVTGHDWATRDAVLASKWRRLYKLRTEPSRRWSAGFSCLFFFWVGAPMAIRRRNSDFFTSFALCFLPILIVYYPFLMYTIDASKNGTIPPISVWIGNAVLFLWGAYLLRKVVRY